MISSPQALADQLECHSLPVTFTSSIRAPSLPVPWVGVLVRRWHLTDPNDNHNHYHNHNHNHNQPNWIMVNSWTIRKQIRGPELDRIGLVFSVLYIFAFHWLSILGCWSYPGTTANWVFYRLLQIPLSTPMFLEVPNHSVLSTIFLYRAQM